MNRITKLFNIRYPIIQAGMIWCSDWKLASAVSNAGGLGLIGSGSMNTQSLKEEIRKCREATDKPFGVNIPLLFPHAPEMIDAAISDKVNVVFTSAGNPATYTSKLKDAGVKVVHVVAGVKFAVKCQETGVDAVVAEGFEAGGHNGKEETTTMVLIPHVRQAISIPLIAAGGIATGRAMLAAFALGAEGVQIGSRFVASVESSAHQNFKQKIVEAREGDTFLTLKRIIPVRLIKNKFFRVIEELERRGATTEEISQHLGRGRAKLGMQDGDVDEGELEIGQISAMINSVKPATKIVEEIIEEFFSVKKEMENIQF